MFQLSWTVLDFAIRLNDNIELRRHREEMALKFMAFVL